ncbi:UPF0146 family protein [Halobaculum litoreum]|uniref:UPF0146 family protein n=1 Tax=Halobaculum litoreum TaxID=3031998 RepID=UPI0024C340C0|nr:UPF0146 family protein [Halobaculum sp. DT92]
MAAALATAGRDVTATDVVARDVPAGVGFVRDDLVAAAAREDPGDAYRADCVYALNVPPELHRPLATVARRVDAACCFTTLGSDPPAVDATPLALDGGDTLYVVRDPGGAVVDR